MEHIDAFVAEKNRNMAFDLGAALEEVSWRIGQIEPDDRAGLRSIVCLIPLADNIGFEWDRLSAALTAAGVEIRIDKDNSQVEVVMRKKNVRLSTRELKSA